MIPGSNTTITTYRLTNSLATQVYASGATLSGVEAYIESAGAEVRISLDVAPNVELFVCYIDAGDVKLGDKVVDASSVEYRVQAIERSEGNQDVDDIYKLILGKTAAMHA